MVGAPGCADGACTRVGGAAWNGTPISSTPPVQAHARVATTDMANAVVTAATCRTF
jgi:hypothetical protein